MFNWVFLSVAVVAVLGLGSYAYVRLRRASTAEFRTLRCPRCAQKIRYLASKEGRSALCPRCKHSVTLAKITVGSIEYSRLGDKPVSVGQVVRRNSWYRGQIIHRS